MASASGTCQMAETLDDLSAWLTPLLMRLQPAQRAKLAREAAKRMRRTQQQRILVQRNPDGTAFTPRKARTLRSKQGRIKARAKMFTKLRTARYLKAGGSAAEATVSFAGRISRIARIHQYGLRDRPGKGMPDVQYAKRELLGFAPGDRDMLSDLVLENLTR